MILIANNVIKNFMKFDEIFINSKMWISSSKSDSEKNIYALKTVM